MAQVEAAEEEVDTDVALMRLRREYACLVFETWLEWVQRSGTGRLVPNYHGSVEKLQQVGHYCFEDSSFSRIPDYNRALD